MDISGLLEYAGPVIYASLAIAALYGLFCVVLLVLRVQQKKFSSPAAAGEFLQSVRERMDAGDFEGAAEVCDTPAHWAKALPQLVMVALSEKDRPLPALRRQLEEKFERDVIADLEYRQSWVGTIVKAAPMLGLLGTVSGMIGAFAKIAATKDTGVDPTAMANDISFALFTTAMGLAVAIPLTILGAWARVRIGRLADAVEQNLAEFLDDFDAARTA